MQQPKQEVTQSTTILMKIFQTNSPKTIIYWTPNILIGPTTATNGRPNPRHVQDTNGALVSYKAIITHPIQPQSVDEYLDLRSFSAVLRSNQELLLASTTPLEIDHYKTEITKIEKMDHSQQHISLLPSRPLPFQMEDASSLRSTQLTLHVTTKMDQ